MIERSLGQGQRAAPAWALKPVVVVGAGVAGLIAAVELHNAGMPVIVLEARSRIGGRVHSIAAHPGSAHRVDLGASWYWPDLNPRMVALVDKLGIASYPQHVKGDMLVERFTLEPVLRASGFVAGIRALRLVGGTASLVEALASRLPEASVALEHVVESVRLGSDGVNVFVDMGTTSSIIEASHVVLAMPPRLAAELTFAPEIDPTSLAVWSSTPTWMAAQAKVISIFDRPEWRMAGLSGAAQSLIGPLAEIHDSSFPDGPGALLGFIRAAPAARRAMGADLVEICVEQLTRLFSERAGQPQRSFLLDWAAEKFTATIADRESTIALRPAPAANDVFTAWNGRLLVAGSETAAVFPGYLEGAVEAGFSAASQLSGRRATS